MFAPPEKLDTARLSLAKWAIDDAQAVFEHYASKPTATKYVSWPAHKSVEDTKSYLRLAINNWDEGNDFSYGVSLKNTQRLVGSIGIIPEDGKIAIGYIFDPGHWGKGYATESLKAILSMLNQQRGVHKIWAVCDVDNVGSARVLEKAGFIREARVSRWCSFPNQDNQAKDCYFYDYPIH
ncbi:MAG: GNAT family N-acetyltransferase [Bacteroidota bacterium]